MLVLEILVVVAVVIDFIGVLGHLRTKLGMSGFYLVSLVWLYSFFYAYSMLYIIHELKLKNYKSKT